MTYDEPNADDDVCPTERDIELDHGHADSPE
jgi:hypothetical protein